eukprot:symbB.v1.2.018853.t1/scaffold1521.1/size113984/3
MSIDYCREQGNNALMRWLRGTPIDVNYDFRRWRKHQVKTRHLVLWTPRNALRWDLLRRLLFPDLAWLGLTSSLLCVYNAQFASSILSLPLVTVTMPSFALGLLITFKTQSGYERFIEARTLWEHLLRESRALSSRILLRVPSVDHGRFVLPVFDAQRRAIKLVTTFPVAMKYHLTEDGCNPHIQLEGIHVDMDSFIQNALMYAVERQLRKGRGKGFSWRRNRPGHARRLCESHFERNVRRSILHGEMSRQLQNVRPHEKGGPCIIKRTVQSLLNERLDGDSAERIFDFLGPGCNFQLHVDGSPAFTFDKALQEMNGRTSTRNSTGNCCGIWLCSGMHRARTRLRCPLSILGPRTREAKIMAADWTIASEYVSLKSVQVVPPPCLRSSVFHTLLKVAAGNVFAMQCDFEAWQKLDGPGHETQGSYCLKVHKAAKVHLQQCHFHAARRTAVDLRCPEVTVSHCTFLDCCSSIDCGLNVALQRMYSEHRPSVRILSTSFENSEQLDEVLWSKGPPAVLVRKQFASATVKDCIFQNVNRDAIATNCTSQIIANHITAAGTAIWVNGGGNDELEEPQVVSEISKNRLERCGTGILVTRLPKVIVQDNEVENVIDVAIHLRHLGHHETPTENSRVECNTVRESHSRTSRHCS